uniref:Relaxin n=1 Tax=Squalus acanthias TaxID=7797 RepID=RELX_SQUAC|nr:RecName: Full=Relaxin; Contains: RecName: Full=Relaxin B chain; Contains: RecName: Full=Relaxin A chain [Squalus acanthias]
QSFKNAEPGIKLCGREFIRAVIYTCGGSRWEGSPGMSSKCCTYGCTRKDISILC